MAIFITIIKQSPIRKKTIIETNFVAIRRRCSRTDHGDTSEAAAKQASGDNRNTAQEYETNHIVFSGYREGLNEGVGNNYAIIFESNQTA